MKLLLNLLTGGLLTVLLSGCTEPTVTQPAAPDEHADHDDHDHHGAGPNGGTIGEWGAGDYHTEFTVDHGKQEATVYILGGDAKTAKPIKAEKVLLSINEPAFQVDLLPVPLEGETGGAASRFVGKHESLGKVQEFSGSITAEVEGTPFTGDFKEEAGHDHDH